MKTPKKDTDFLKKLFLLNKKWIKKRDKALEKAKKTFDEKTFTNELLDEMDYIIRNYETEDLIKASLHSCNYGCTGKKEDEDYHEFLRHMQKRAKFNISYIEMIYSEGYKYKYKYWY